VLRAARGLGQGIQAVPNEFTNMLVALRLRLRWGRVDGHGVAFELAHVPQRCLPRAAIPMDMMYSFIGDGMMCLLCPLRFAFARGTSEAICFRSAASRAF
jgi:hypothetical protein